MIILMILIIIVVMITAINIMMIKIILIIAVEIIINNPFQPDDFSTGSTTGINTLYFSHMKDKHFKIEYHQKWVIFHITTNLLVIEEGHNLACCFLSKACLQFFSFIGLPR